VRAISGREASIFACLTDTVVAPDPLLPPVRETDAVAFFDRWVSRVPRLNRVGLRVVLWAIELGPLVTGRRHRLRRLPVDERAGFLRDLERAPRAEVRQVMKLIKGAAFLSYYGDDRVMRRVGYDADANVRRGRELRRLDGRP
jgi:predicted signal transduction protein with EAL and GGDEF domain